MKPTLFFFKSKTKLKLSIKAEWLELRKAPIWVRRVIIQKNAKLGKTSHGWQNRHHLLPLHCHHYYFLSLWYLQGMSSLSLQNICES